ncbi:MAG: NUDIX domain-containing protein [candidate division Zixibacteria bacterium]|nr:NUDIX domain-containing protein [candidate division Zixibacteria bacterium]
MSEFIDVYDADLRLLGTEERVKAHMEGLWHKTFHLWLTSPRNGGQILYQWRSKEMKNFPDMLDVSAAGHILAGETVEQGIREAEEELGISLDYRDIHSLGYRVEVADQENGQKNREYQAVHLAKLDLDLEDFTPQVEEVSGLIWLSIARGIELFTGKAESVDCDGIYYDAPTRTWKKNNRGFALSHFLPRIQRYYLTIHIMSERLLAGNKVLAVS